MYFVFCWDRYCVWDEYYVLCLVLDVRFCVESWSDLFILRFFGGFFQGYKQCLEHIMCLGHTPHFVLSLRLVRCVLLGYILCFVLMHDV